MGSVSDKYKEKVKIEDARMTDSWEFVSKSLELCEEKIEEESIVLLDTGSSKIVFPKPMCDRILVLLQNKFGIRCLHTFEGIACNRLHNIGFEIEVDGGSRIKIN